MKNNQLAGIDIAKFWFCLCVVAMHCKVIDGLPTEIHFWVSKLMFLPAVPFFFVASGFFLGRKIEQKGEGTAIKEYCLRMLPILLVFESVAIFTNVIAYYRGGMPLTEIIVKVIKAILFYPWGSMWYIQACIVGGLIILMLKKQHMPVEKMSICGIVLYVIGLLLYSYRFLLDAMGLEIIPNWYAEIFVSHRNGLFFGFPLIMIGYFIQNKRIVENIKTKQIDYVLILSTILMVIEMSALEQSDDCIIGELIFASALFIRIAKYSKVKTSVFTRLLRKLSVGIYVMHRPLMTVWGVVLSKVNMSQYKSILFILTLFSAVTICLIIYKKLPKLEKLVA